MPHRLSPPERPLRSEWHVDIRPPGLQVQLHVPESSGRASKQKPQRPLLERVLRCIEKPSRTKGPNPACGRGKSTVRRAQDEVVDLKQEPAIACQHQHTAMCASRSGVKWAQSPLSRYWAVSWNPFSTEDLAIYWLGTSTKAHPSCTHSGNCTMQRSVTHQLHGHFRVPPAEPVIGKFARQTWFQHCESMLPSAISLQRWGIELIERSATLKARKSLRGVHCVNHGTSCSLGLSRTRRWCGTTTSPTFDGQPSSYQEYRKRVSLFSEKMVHDGAGDQEDGGDEKPPQLPRRLAGSVRQRSRNAEGFRALLLRCQPPCGQIFIQDCSEHREAARESERHDVKLPGWAGGSSFVVPL